MSVRVRRGARRFDEARGCYVYDVSFKPHVRVSERVRGVAEAFGVDPGESREVLYRDFQLHLGEGDVIYVTGDSGSGKSVLLRVLREDLGDRAIDIEEVEVDDGAVLVDAVGKTLSEALNLLSRVGLNDAHLFLRSYGELSEGQRYRFRIAKMVESGRRFWVADEFCSTLDRTTARIVAFNIQKQARRCGATLVAATSHTDLEADLNPSIVVRKGWGEEIRVEYRVNAEAPQCTVSDGVAIEKGDRDDYKRLSHFHYRGGSVRFPIAYYRALVDGGLAGVIVYCYPGVSAAGRRKAVGYTPRIDELNEDWAVVSRVVIHPKYRSTGLGARLLHDTLPLVGRHHIEMTAAMAEYNPFAEKAGMMLVTKTHPDESITRAIEALHRIGFDTFQMTSERRNAERLLEDPARVQAVREILTGVAPYYYKRLRRGGQPYLGVSECMQWLTRQSPASLAECLATLATLNQTKAYLHWSPDPSKKGGRPNNQ
jgi:ABC-type transport system involved in cytochrome c biogenesis ATPase subunit/GNAT superfamily N-acetyltransferase